MLPKSSKDLWYVSLVVFTFIGCSGALLGLSSAFSEDYQFRFILLTCIITLFTLFLLIRIAFTNPGYLAKITCPSDEPIRIIEVFGHTILLKACSTCNIIKPPRAHHCRQCNLCVDRRDHHCPWVANCIGRHNHRLFMVLLHMIVTDSLYAMAHCIYIIIEIESPPGAYIVEGIVLFVGFISFWLVGGLYGYHLYLMITNQTTYEQKRKVFPSGNPFQKDYATNCRLFWSMIPEEIYKGKI